MLIHRFIRGFTEDGETIGEHAAPEANLRLNPQIWAVISGLAAEQATWTSLMMALNIDGKMGGNGWQSTQWPWYSSIFLE